MPSSAALPRLQELAPAPGVELSAAEAAALAECCGNLLRPDGGGDAEAVRSALDALCAAGGDAMRRHADGLAPLVLARLGDGDAAVREAARRFLVLLMEMKEVNARMENVEPNTSMSGDRHDYCATIEMKSSDASQVRRSSKEKISTREVPLSTGGDIMKNSVVPIKVVSEKDLLREIEKLITTLQPENEWSIRITAMQRLEGLVLGGAVDYSAFPMLLKQLVTPLITQFLDRRSSVVKQACHLLNFLSKELLRDFEPCAELLIPVLLKNVVITVLVIAESVHNCIKEMLRNCKVARILPRIIDFAKNDRSAVLRARCCEYAILMLEYWVDTPEIQRSADLYEDLIKCCIADATSEVRSSARSCYRMFSRIWPERSHHLFTSFEPSRQKMINDEDTFGPSIVLGWSEAVGASDTGVGSLEGTPGPHMPQMKASPILNDEDVEAQQWHLPQVERVKLRQPQPSYNTLAVMDREVKMDSGTSFSCGDLQPLQKPCLQFDGMSSKGPTEGSKDDTSAIGSLFEDRSVMGPEVNEYTVIEKCDSDTTADIYSLGYGLPSATPLATEPLREMSLSDATVVTIVQDKAENKPDIAEISQQVQAPEDTSKLRSMSPTVNMKGSGKLLKQSPVTVNSDAISPGPRQVGKHRVSTPKKSIASKGQHDSYTPNFQRPLLSKQITNWFYASIRTGSDDKKPIFGEMISNMDVPSSLTEALSLGVNPRSDWMMRVYSFNFLRQCLLERGPKGIQEVAQKFEKVMRFVCRYLDDSHHKVAQASLSSLVEIMPVFKKLFEQYLDKTLPYIFSRLNDPKESIKQQCLAILKVASEIYSIDSLLPACLRSLDEQKSPKLKLSVIEFANSSFVKCTVNSECYSSSSFLKPWLGKLALLFKDKNNKLKEVAVVGFSSIYSHYDPASVLSFLVSMSMEEQKRLTRAMKQLVPTTETGMEEFLQQRRHHQKPPSFDPFNAKSPLHPGYQFSKSPLHPAYQFAKSPLHPTHQSANSPLHPAHQSSKSPLHSAYHSAKSPMHASYQTNSVEGDDLFGSAHHFLSNTSLKLQEYSPRKIESESNNESYGHKAEIIDEKSNIMSSRNGLTRGSDCRVVSENTGQRASRDPSNSKRSDEPSINFRNNKVMRNNCQDREETVTQFKEISKTNGHYMSTKMSSSLLEMLDDPDEPTRELALSLLVEVLEKQRKAMENCIETLIVKLLHATKDAALKIVNQAHICLTTVVTQFDPLRCLQTVASQFASQDEKLLLICINCLNKLVSRLSQENLTAHLSTFLPGLLDAFENHNSPYVRLRKAGMVCLAETYLKLGPASLLPYLQERQVRVVTAYANRLTSQSRAVAVDG